MGHRYQEFSRGYPSFVSQFVASVPNGAELSFAEWQQKLLETQYWQADFFPRQLSRFGYLSEQFFINVEPVQKAWAREYGVTYREDHWLTDIVIAQITAFRPSLVFFRDTYLLPRAFRDELRQRVSPCPLLIGWWAVAHQDFAEFADLDLVLTATPGFVQEMTAAGCRAVCLPYAFEERLLGQATAQTRDLACTFMGLTGDREGQHSERYRFIEHLMTHTPLEVWSDSEDHPPARSRRGRTQARSIYAVVQALRATGVRPETIAQVPWLGQGASWDADPTLPALCDRYPDRWHAPVFGLEYFRILGRSQITLNRHINAAEEYAGNMRLFEATGMGACLITDTKLNLADYFEPDRELVAYASESECVEKVRYLLDHPAEATAIAAAGQRRTLRDHTYRQRAEQFAQLVADLRQP